MLCCAAIFVCPGDPQVPLVLTWHDKCDGMSVYQKIFNGLELPTSSKLYQTPFVETMSVHLWLPIKPVCGIFMIRYGRFLQSIVDKALVSCKPAQWHACTIVRDVNELLPIISTFIDRYLWNLVYRTYKHRIIHFSLCEFCENQCS
jgi:hypothetical protein